MRIILPKEPEPVIVTSMAKEIIPHKQIKFSQRLIDMEKLLEISEDEMAFLLNIKQEMYRRYRLGEWDANNNSIRKERMVLDLDNIHINIREKMSLFTIMLRQYKKKLGENGTPIFTPNGKHSAKKLKPKPL